MWMSITWEYLKYIFLSHKRANVIQKHVSRDGRVPFQKDRAIKLFFKWHHLFKVCRCTSHRGTRLLLELYVTVAYFKSVKYISWIALAVAFRNIRQQQKSAHSKILAWNSLRPVSPGFLKRAQENHHYEDWYYWTKRQTLSLIENDVGWRFGKLRSEQSRGGIPSFFDALIFLQESSSSTGDQSNHVYRREEKKAQDLIKCSSVELLSASPLKGTLLCERWFSLFFFSTC